MHHNPKSAQIADQLELDFCDSRANTSVETNGHSAEFLWASSKVIRSIQGRGPLPILVFDSLS